MALEIKGFEDVFKDLDDMDISDTKKRRALRSGAEIIFNSIKKNSPKRSGTMEKRWKSKITRIDGDLAFKIEGDTPQDIENEFGSSTNKKHIGFFSNAVDEVSNSAINIIVKEVFD